MPKRLDKEPVLIEIRINYIALIIWSLLFATIFYIVGVIFKTPTL